MDIDAITTEKRMELLKKQACFNCKKTGHHARDCPNKDKKWPAKEAAQYIRSILALYTPEEEEEIRQAAKELNEEDFWVGELSQCESLPDSISKLY